MSGLLTRIFWQCWRRSAVRELAARLDSVTKQSGRGWYYYIDFGYGVTVRQDLKNDPYSGTNNWRHSLSRHLPEIAGKRILDLGCNAGLYDLYMVDAGAREVIGLDQDICQAEFLLHHFARTRRRDYSRLRFLRCDVATFDLTSLGQFDIVGMFCVAYHFGSSIFGIMEQVREMTPTVALQGNLRRLTLQKYQHREFQHLAGVEGMQSLLTSYGYVNVDVYSPRGHPKPLVVGHREERGQGSTICGAG